MKVYLNNINGVPNAIISMFMSKRTWTPELNDDVLRVCSNLFNYDGTYSIEINNTETYEDDKAKLDKWLKSLFKFGQKHFTMLRFIDFSCTVEGLHRAGQDDFDSHAKRLDNRIIRSSTRLSDFGGSEKSDYYKDKILTTDEICSLQGIELPTTITINNKNYVKSVNGYILEEYATNKDIKRGLYMLSIPSNFVFTCNITEFAHIVKERDINSNANAEVKQMIEIIIEKLREVFPQLTRDYYYDILN